LLCLKNYPLLPLFFITLTLRVLRYVYSSFASCVYSLPRSHFLSSLINHFKPIFGIRNTGPLSKLEGLAEDLFHDIIAGYLAADPTSITNLCTASSCMKTRLQPEVDRLKFERHEKYHAIKENSLSGLAFSFPNIKYLLEITVIYRVSIQIIVQYWS
jgi:hypothetical protein